MSLSLTLNSINWLIKKLILNSFFIYFFVDNINIKLNVWADFSRPWQIDFQDPASSIMEGIINFHDDVMFLLIIVLTFVLWMIVSLSYTFSKTTSYYSKKSIFDKILTKSLLEVVWTLVPSFILVLIAIPSFGLLYTMDDTREADVSFKVVGHQWYWTYDCHDHYVGKFNFKDKSLPISWTASNITFDSYMVDEFDLEEGQLRLLEVDNPIVVPKGSHVRILVTSSDVIHSWAVPSLGIKVDATPGRLNQTIFYAKRWGTFYGQCSEICGVNHAFMPICVKVVDYYPTYFHWIMPKDHFYGCVADKVFGLNQTDLILRFLGTTYDQLPNKGRS